MWCTLLGELDLEGTNGCTTLEAHNYAVLLELL